VSLSLVKDDTTTHSTKTPRLVLSCFWWWVVRLIGSTATKVRCQLPNFLFFFPFVVVGAILVHCPCWKFFWNCVNICIISSLVTVLFVLPLPAVLLLLYYPPLYHDWIGIDALAELSCAQLVRSTSISITSVRAPQIRTITRLL